MILSLCATESRAAFTCTPKDVRNFVSLAFKGRDDASEYISNALAGKKVKQFNLDRYLDQKEIFREVETLPPIPKNSDHEARLAWLETAETRAMATATDQKFVKALPTVEEVMRTGTSRQKRMLINWNKKYGSLFDEKFSQRELRNATLDLSLILNNSRLDLGGLAADGLKGVSLESTLVQTHARTLERGMIDIFGEDLVHSDRFMDQVKNLYQKNSVKWPINAAVNTGYFLTSKYVFNSLLLTLPKHQLAKIAADDMLLILTEGWAKHGARIAEKYAPKVQKQIYYNALKNLFSNLSYGTTAYMAGLVIRNHFRYEDELDRKKHQTDKVRPTE